MKSLESFLLVSHDIRTPQGAPRVDSKNLKKMSYNKHSSLVQVSIWRRRKECYDIDMSIINIGDCLYHYLES
jgi:hypothetical protein